MHTYLTTTKFVFTLAVIVLTLSITFGIYASRERRGLSFENLSRIVSGEFARLAFVSGENHNLAAAGLAGVASSTAAANGTAADIPVLLYHGVVDTPDRFSLTQAAFKDQLTALKDAGYHTITLEDFYAFERGEKVLDNKSFLLTFDDGREDSYYGADPILKALGFNAVMFVATDASLSKDPSNYYLHENELQRMVDSGRWELGSHAVQATGGFVPIDAAGTQGNFLSNKAWLPDEGRLETDDEFKTRITHELVDAKSVLESDFNITVEAFAYPFGDYGQQTVNYPGSTAVVSDVIKANYEDAFQQVWSNDNYFTSNYPGDDMYHMKRIESGTDWTGQELLSVIQNARAKALPYSDDLARDAGWKSTWGVVGVQNNLLSLGAKASTTGAFAFLDGTENWKGYMFAATVRKNAGSDVSLIADFQDEDDYATCTFEDDLVVIQEKVAGVTRTLLEKKNGFATPYPDVTLGILTSGSTVTCYEGSSVAASSSGLDPSLDHGGIALRIWDEDLNNASLDVSAVKVASAKDADSLAETLPQYESIALPQSTSSEEPEESALADESESVAVSTPPDDALPYTLDLAHPDFNTSPNKIVAADDALALKTVIPNTTAYAVLHEGSDWKDYAFEASVKQGVSSKFTALARYADSKNYVACEYSDQGESVALVEVKDGQRYLRGSGHNPLSDTQKSGAVGQTVGVRASGSSLACLGNNGASVVEADVPTAPLHGTIGFKVYAAMPGFATLFIRSVSVTSL